MKIKNSIFVDGRVPALNKLIEEPLEISEAYKLLKFSRELKAKEENYTSARYKIFEKYGKKNKDGELEIKGKKNTEKATEEMNELLNIEEEYEFDKKVKLPEGVKLSTKELMLLEDIVEIPEE